MKFYKITEKHKAARWKLLLGGFVLLIINALGNISTNPAGMVQAFFTGPVIGYMVWCAWAKTKNYPPVPNIDHKIPCQKCRSVNDSAAKFCTGCGNALSQSFEKESISSIGIIEINKTPCWKFLLGGAILISVAGLRRTDFNPMNLIYTLPFGIFAGYISWLASAKTKITASSNNIGGWLIVIASGLAISLVTNLYYLITFCLQIFTDGTWETITTPGNDAYHPLLGGFIYFNIAGGFIFLALTAITLMHLILRSRHTKKIAIAYFLLSSVFITLIYFIPSIISLPTGQNDPDLRRELVGSLIRSAIFIPYFLLSRRVKLTLVK
jgi:hypothetical protein